MSRDPDISVPEWEARHTVAPLPITTMATNQAVRPAIPFSHRSRWRWRWNWLAYVPLVPYVVWLMIRHRSPTVFTAANPGIATGGTLGESKATTLSWIERAGGPVAEFCVAGSHSVPRARALATTERMRERGFTFPVIVKPDVGEQGWGVALIRSQHGLERYFECMPFAVIIQRYFPGIEAGIFYIRRPNAECGHIVALCQSIHRRRVPNEHDPDEAPSIAFGFRCHDAEYRDALHWNSPELERAIDAHARAVPGFFLGRFDVCAPSVDALRRGDFASSS